MAANGHHKAQSGSRKPPLAHSSQPSFSPGRPSSSYEKFERDQRDRSNHSSAFRSRSHQRRENHTLPTTLRKEDGKLKLSWFDRGLQYLRQDNGGKNQDNSQNLGGPVSKQLTRQEANRIPKPVTEHLSPPISTLEQNTAMVPQTTNEHNLLATNGNHRYGVQQTNHDLAQRPALPPRDPANCTSPKPPSPPPKETHVPQEADMVENASEEHRNLEIKLDEQSNTITQFTKVFDDQNKVIDDLTDENNSLLEQVANLRDQLSREIDEREQTITSLRKKLSNAADKSAKVPAHAPLSRPESELVKDWGALAYDIRNLVDNHLVGGRFENRISAWAQSRGAHLRDITPNPLEVASNRKPGAALIEAAIWRALIESIFGSYDGVGLMCWAGRYKERLQRLSSSFQNSLAEVGNLDASYQQWKALTASIVSTIQLPHDQEDEVGGILENLESLLEPCRSKMGNSRAYHHELQSLVVKAIGLDLKFAGQRACYQVHWPTQPHFNVSFDERSMKPANEGSQTPEKVKFMIQPCLLRSEAPGDFNNLTVVDQCTVWLY